MRLFYSLSIGIPLLLSLNASPAAEMTDVVRKLSAAVRSRADWISEAKTCPADVLPQKESRSYLAVNNCTAQPQLASCLAKCTAGDGGSCYWLAYAMQQAHSETISSEALFQRSCKLGIMSGCTNRAAGMLSDDPDNRTVQQCAAQTFAKVCDFDDPWACSMYALHLSRGLGVPQNPGLALKVLEKSCKYGAEDPACIGGMKLKRALEQGSPNDTSRK
ncbi:sel1 repeat family protein [Duganella sp. FT92W]|uniref:Sel1 repeat family protein n=2 Tax=Pseudoduganella rivuli TaxID=2666085 RepID=A0A7X2IKT1_9BURK|nr:sel1 repeat family protein [Pseudoduganella rivuli]